MIYDIVDKAIGDHKSSIQDKQNTPNSQTKKKPGRKKSQESYRKDIEKVLKRQAKEADKIIANNIKTTSKYRESNITKDVIEIWHASLIDGYELFSKLDFIERHKIPKIILSDIETIQWFTIGSTWDNEYKAYSSGLEILFNKTYRHVANLIKIDDRITCNVCNGLYNHSFIVEVNILTCSKCGKCIRF